MEKVNKGTMTKIKNRRTIIVVILLLPLIIISWIPYLWPGISSKIMNLITKITIFSFACSLLLFTSTNGTFIEKQLEDKQLKDGNYKFKYKEQFFRYVHPDVIRIALIMLYFPIMLFIKTRIDKMGIIDNEMIGAK